MIVTYSYCVQVDEYRDDWVWAEETPEVGEATIGISKEDYEALEKAGVKCEVFTQIVFEPTKYCGSNGTTAIKQVIIQHCAYAKQAHHSIDCQ